MKFISVIILAIGLSMGAKAQVKISPAEISGHVGDSVSVTITVTGGRYFSGSATPITLLNAGGDFPNQLLTIVMYDELRKTYTDAPEKYYPGKTVTVVGKVVLYKERPQIVIHSKEQLVETTKQ